MLYLNSLRSTKSAAGFRNKTNTQCHNSLHTPCLIKDQRPTVMTRGGWGWYRNNFARLEFPPYRLIPHEMIIRLDKGGSKVDIV